MQNHQKDALNFNLRQFSLRDDAGKEENINYPNLQKQVEAAREDLATAPQLHDAREQYAPAGTSEDEVAERAGKAELQYPENRLKAPSSADKLRLNQQPELARLK
jgi:hypothetical protein